MPAGKKKTKQATKTTFHNFVKPSKISKQSSEPPKLRLHSFGGELGQPDQPKPIPIKTRSQNYHSNATAANYEYKSNENFSIMSTRISTRVHKPYQVLTMNNVVDVKPPTRNPIQGKENYQIFHFKLQGQSPTSNQIDHRKNYPQNNHFVWSHQMSNSERSQHFAVVPNQHLILSSSSSIQGVVSQNINCSNNSSLTDLDEPFIILSPYRENDVPDSHIRIPSLKSLEKSLMAFDISGQQTSPKQEKLSKQEMEKIFKRYISDTEVLSSHLNFQLSSNGLNSNNRTSVNDQTS